MNSPADAYLGLFERSYQQSAASIAYHERFREPNDRMLWLSRLRVPRQPSWLDKLPEGRKARGVLHVGAHYGLELEAYLSHGCRRVTFFEASPLVLSQLRAHVDFWRDWLAVLGIQERLQVDVVECAVSDHEGEVCMHLAELEMLSSLHQPTADWIQVQDRIRVPCARLEELVKTPADYNVLNLDVQGHELAVLRGAAALLPRLEAVLVELNYAARYQDEADPVAVDRVLAEAGFTCIDQTRYGDVADCLYVKR